MAVDVRADLIFMVSKTDRQQAVFLVKTEMLQNACLQRGLIEVSVRDGLQYIAASQLVMRSPSRSCFAMVGINRLAPVPSSAACLIADVFAAVSPRNNACRSRSKSRSEYGKGREKNQLQGTVCCEYEYFTGEELLPDDAGYRHLAARSDKRFGSPACAAIRP